MKKVCVDLRGSPVGFDDLCDIASLEAARASALSPDGMTVVAWFDSRSKRSFPEVGFTDGSVVHWENSAASCGAEVRVEVDGGNYIILCGSSRKH